MLPLGRNRQVGTAPVAAAIRKDARDLPIGRLGGISLDDSEHPRRAEHGCESAVGHAGAPVVAPLGQVRGVRGARGENRVEGGLDIGVGGCDYGAVILLEEVLVLVGKALEGRAG